VSNQRVWLFDLDNTLHDANPHIFPAMSRAMLHYVAEKVGVGETAARALRDEYWQRYGATLTGLVRHHGVDPHDFLARTHDFLDDLPRMVVHQAALRHALKKLPGRKILFSNAPHQYVEAILAHIGIRRLFDSVWTIERLRFTPKPHPGAFRQLLRTERLDPRLCIFVEDSPANLRAAKQLGMKTVLVSPTVQAPAYVDTLIKSVLELPKRGLMR
jgi:putative hydrolase of the HAD superfamily